MWASRGPLSSADAKEGLQQSEHGMGMAGAEDGDSDSMSGVEKNVHYFHLFCFAF